MPSLAACYDNGMCNSVGSVVRRVTFTKLVLALVSANGLIHTETIAGPAREPTLTEQSGAEKAAGCTEWDTDGYFYSRNLADVEVCIAAGYSLGMLDRIETTPLHRAASATELPAVIQALLVAGADPNARDESGMTPLHWAAAHNSNAAVTHTLLDAGADANAPTDDHSTPLCWAGFNKNSAVVQALLDAGADPNATDDDGWAPVHCAASNEANEAVLALARAGADPNARTVKDEIPLHFASYAGTASVPILLGNNVKARNAVGQTALHFAAESAKQWELIDMLVASGADIGARDVWGGTPMHRFAWRTALGFDAPEPADFLKTLMANGASIDAQDILGDTPLHHAARFSHSGPVIHALLDAGADGQMLNAKQQTPWDMARSNDGLRKRHEDAYWRLHEARLGPATPTR